MESMLKGEAYQPTDESLEEHMRRFHPDPQVTAIRRRALEAEVEAKWRREGKI
jgi:hypothetical protein